MYAPRAETIMELERQRMWNNMNLPNQGGGCYDNTTRCYDNTTLGNTLGNMMDPKLMYGYSSMMNEYIPIQQQQQQQQPVMQALQCNQAMQGPHKDVMVQQKCSTSSSKGKKGDGKRNFFAGGGASCGAPTSNRNVNTKGGGPKEGTCKQSINPSKRHRDRLNCELDNLAKLLPFSEEIIARLDKLSILRLSVSYLRNKNYFKNAPIQHNDDANNVVPTPTDVVGFKAIDRANPFAYLFKKAIDGFLLVITLTGEIFFVSESVKDHLGYSQSQVLHQPLDTFVHDDDKEELLNHLCGPTPKIEEIKEGGDEFNLPDEQDDIAGQTRDFVIRLKSVLNTSSSDMYKPFGLNGTIRALNIEPEVESLKYALFAFCTPAQTSLSILELRMKTTLFCSKNRIDLSFLDIDARGKEFFGYSKKDIFGRSSYVLVHRFDLRHLRCKHTEIMTCGKSSIATFRLMTKNHEWSWVCGFARVVYKNGKPDYVVTTNRMMSEKEGLAMLRYRDEVDRKALAQLGLIEPDEPGKAMELGFPEHPSSADSLDMHTADTNPIPMMLEDIAGVGMGSAINPPPIQLKSEFIESSKSPSMIGADGNNQYGHWSGENTFSSSSRGGPDPDSYPSCQVTSDKLQSKLNSDSSSRGWNREHYRPPPPQPCNMISTNNNLSDGVRGGASSNSKRKTDLSHTTTTGGGALYPTSLDQLPLHSHHTMKLSHSDHNAAVSGPSLFDDLTNLDLVQQQIQEESERYPHGANSIEKATNDYYRHSVLGMGGMRENIALINSNNRGAMYSSDHHQQMGGSNVQQQIGASDHFAQSTNSSPYKYNTSNNNSGGVQHPPPPPQGAYEYTPTYIDNRALLPSNHQSPVNSHQTLVNLQQQQQQHAQQQNFKYSSFPEDSAGLPSAMQGYLPENTYSSWTQM